MPKAKPKIDEDDFEALDRLARSISPAMMRPLSPEMRRRWEAARRGRPRKAPEEKAIPTMITVEPDLLKQIDAATRKAGVSRSQFFAVAARNHLKKAG